MCQDHCAITIKRRILEETVQQTAAQGMTNAQEGSISPFLRTGVVTDLQGSGAVSRLEVGAQPDLSFGGAGTIGRLSGARGGGNPHAIYAPLGIRVIESDILPASEEPTLPAVSFGILCDAGGGTQAISRWERSCVLCICYWHTYDIAT